MHRTYTIDYGIVLEGEVVLLLPGGREVHLKPGDIVVQRPRTMLDRTDPVALHEWLSFSSTANSVLSWLPSFLI
jgi:hypothetical protein